MKKYIIMQEIVNKFCHKLLMSCSILTDEQYRYIILNSDFINCVDLKTSDFVQQC